MFIIMASCLGDWKQVQDIIIIIINLYFVHEIVSFYIVFLGIVFKTRLKCSKELLDY